MYALLRRWLWVRAPPNPLSILRLGFPGKQLIKPLGGRSKMAENEAAMSQFVGLCCTFSESLWPT
jgi:hypothetical protein